ncbi:hypothetical protein DPMN_110407 [Dreissena polymorpha]|uniref:HAT C-terminal dimerisation domain-containing protein n=1 Tax=Dreissena polymorpha TaxID=45954 RepID=A0A9D4QN30_DREPO|nr:hypothetical protein DPMN_110407 [Dreissena polymorpha]
MDKLQLANKVMNPKYLPTVPAEVCKYGKNEVEEICKWLGAEGETDGLIDSNRMVKDNLQFKMVLKHMKGRTLKVVCQEIISSFQDMFPDYVVLAKYILTAPVTSVACERCFSIQNRLKT